MVIPGDPKDLCAFTVKVELYEGQEMNKFLTSDRLTENPVCTQTHPKVLSQCQNALLPQTHIAARRTPHLLPDLQGEDYYNGKSQLEANWKLPLPGNIVNQKQDHNPGETAKISNTVKELKDTDFVIRSTSECNSPIELFNLREDKSILENGERFS